ncbi:hypothetical protein H0H92_005956 [Tricholoma furcatifolium]|nr:hypothetical protein H0H92_005956 [Tricholoma furcatifolium]
MLRDLSVSEAVGYMTTYIKKVSKITLYVDEDRVNGIETVYDISNAGPATVMNGTRIEGEFFVGIFGAEDANSQPTLRRVGFLVYNKLVGTITPAGAFPSKLPDNANVKGFSSLGIIIGFSGTTAANGQAPKYSP